MANIITPEQRYNKIQDNLLDNPVISDSKLNLSSDVLNKTIELRNNRGRLRLNSKPLGVNAEDYLPYFNNSHTIVSAESDLDEQRAQLQSGSEQLRNGFMKMLGTTATTAIDGFLGTAAGLVNLAQGENYSDNPVTRTMVEWQEKMEQVFPNYYTKEETQSSNPFKGFIPGTQGSANFWGDKFMKNLGFTMGMAIDGALMGGLINTALGTSKTAAMIGKYIANAADEGGASLTEMGNLVKGLKSGTIDVSKFDDAIKAGAAAVRRKTIATQVASSVFASQAEARFEAINQMDQTRKEQTAKLDQELEGKYNNLIQIGYDPQKAEEIISKERTKRTAEIEDAVEASGNAVFGLNMALLSATNFIEFKNAFANGFKFNRKGLSAAMQGKVNAGNVAGSVGEKIEGTFGNYAAKASKGFLEKTGSGIVKGGKMIKNALTEGFEEGAQQSIQSGSDYYYTSKLNPNSKKEAVGIADAFTYGIEQGFGTKMGLEQVFIGALTGALGVPTPGGRRGVQWGGGIVNDIREEMRNSKQAKTIASQLNSAAAHITYQKAKDYAAVNGDEFDYKNNDHAQFFNTVTTFAKAGKLNDLIEQLDGYANTKGDDIRKMLITKDAEGKEVDPNLNKTNTQLEQDAKKKIAKLKEKALHIAQTREDIQTLFPGASEKVADELSYQASTIKDVEDRIKTLSDEISHITGLTSQTDRVHKKKLKDSDEFEANTETINKFVEENPTLSEVKQDFEDLNKLIKRRDKFIDTYKDLVTPEGQEKLEKKIKKEEEKPVQQAKKNFRTDLHGKIVRDKETGNSYMAVVDPKTGDTHLTPTTPYGESTKGEPITHTADEMSEDFFNSKYEVANKLERPKGDELFDTADKVKPEEPEAEQKPEVDERVADIERRREEELEAYAGQFAHGDLTVGWSDAINAKYDAELKALEDVVDEKDKELSEESKEPEEDPTVTEDGEHHIDTTVSNNVEDFPDYTGKRTAETLFTRLGGAQTVRTISKTIKYLSGKVKKIFGITEDPNQKRYFNWVTNTKIKNQGYKGKLLYGRELYGDNWEVAKAKIVEDIINQSNVSVKDMPAYREKVNEHIENSLYVVMVKDGRYVTDKGMSDTIDPNHVIFTSFPAPDTRTIHGYTKVDESQPEHLVKQAVDKFKQQHDEIVERKKSGDVFIDIKDKTQGIQNFGFKSKYINDALKGHDVELRVNTVGDVVTFDDGVTHTFRKSDKNNKKVGNIVIKDKVTDNTYTAKNRLLSNNEKKILKDLLQLHINQKGGGKADNKLRNKQGVVTDITIFKVFAFFLGNHLANTRKETDKSWELYSKSGEFGSFMWFQVDGVAKEIKVFDITKDKRGNFVTTFAPGFEEFFDDWLSKQYHSISSSALKNSRPARIIRSVDLTNNTVEIDESFNKADGYKEYLLDPKDPKIFLDVNPEIQEGMQELSKSGYKEYDELLKVSQNLEFTYQREEVVETKTAEEDEYNLNRRALGETKNAEDIEAARTWFEKRFPNVDYNVVKRLIDGRNWGQFRAAAVYIYENAEVGTTFHEAWHVVTHLYLTRNEVTNLYDDYAKSNGLAKENWFDENGKLTEAGKKIEEALADDFMDWKLGKQISYFKSRKQRTFFGKLMDMIKHFLKLDIHSVERIFKRIDSGYYSNRPKVNGIQDISNRINPKLGLNEAKAHQLNQSLTTLVMSYIFDPQHTERVKSLFTHENNTEVLDGMYDYAKSFIEKKMNNFRSAKNDDMANQLQHILDVFDIARSEHTKFLYSELNIQVSDENGEVEQTQNDKMQLRSESGVKRSVKESTTNNMKLLLSSLPACYFDKDGKRKNKLNDFGLPYVADFGMMFSVLGNKLAGSESLQSMDAKMEQLQRKYPEIESLRNRLKIFNTLSIDETTAQNQMEFFQAFSRNYYEYWMDMFKDGKNIFFNATINKLENRTKEEWANMIGDVARKNPDLYDRSVGDETVRYNSKGFEEKYPLITDDNVFEFLKDIGVKFTNPGEIKMMLIERGQYGLLTETARQIRKKIIKAKDGNFPILFDNNIDTGMDGNVNFLLHLESGVNTDFFENSHYDINGENKYNLGLNSYTTQIFNTLNNVTNREQLVDRCPFLNEEECAYLLNSVILKPGGLLFNEDGSKKNIKIEFGFHEGSSSTKTGDKNEYVSLKYPDKLRVKLNNWFASKGYFLMRPGDSDLERTAKFSGMSMVNDLDIENNNFHKQFFNYLTDELNRSAQYTHDGINIKNRTKRALDGIFISLITSEIPGLKGHKIKETLKGHLEGVLEGIKNAANEEEARSIINEFISSDANQQMFKRVIEDFMDYETENLFKNCVNNGLIIRNEEGDVSINGLELDLVDKTEEVVKQQLKRYVINDKAWVVEQTKVLTGDPTQFKSLEDQFKRHTSMVSTKRTTNDDWHIQMWMDKFLKRSDGKTHYNSNYAKIHGTILTATFADPSGSARALASLKELLGKKSKAYEKYDKADAQGAITLDEYRWLLFKGGQWSFGKGSMEELYQWEIQRAEGIETPVYRNLDGTISHTIEKQPSLKFKPQKLQYFGPVAETGYTNIIYKLSVYPLTPSLIKGNDQLESLNADLKRQKIGIVTFESGNKIGYKIGDNGQANDLYNRSETLVTQNTYSKYWGVQVDSTPKAKTKVVSGTQMMKQILSSMATSGKFTNESLRKLRAEYIKANKRRIELGFNSLITKLGLEKQGKYYIVKDIDSFKETLIREAENRNLPDNIIDGIEFMTSRNGIDTLVNREKVENVLFAIADATAISQKRFGNSAVQASSVLLDETLEFYKTSVIGTEPMQIKIASMFKEFPNLTVADIKKLPDGDKLLSVIGFRIPTQAMSSIDAAIVKEFLPSTMGDMVVLPEEIVAKQGGDFDFDKFNQYFANYYATKDAPVYIRHGSEAELKKGYAEYLKNVRRSKEKREEQDFVERFAELIGEEPTYDESLMTFEQYEHKAIENKIKEVQQSILLDPANAKPLLSPVDAQNLTSAAAYVTWVREGKKDLNGKSLSTWYKEYLDGKPLHNILNAQFVDDISNRFQSGSNAIGIGALYATFVIACQHHGVVFENAVINLAHNKSDKGVDIGGSETVTKYNISDLFNEWLTLFVDAPKEPHMFNLGVDMRSVNVALMLTQSGVDPKTLGLFLSQPIIQRYLEAVEKNYSMINKESGRDLKYDALFANVVSTFNNTLLDEENSLSGSDYKSYTPVTLTPEILENMILKQDNPKDRKLFCLMQNQVLEDFLRYQKYSSEISSAMQAINMDTAGGGKNVSEMLYKLSLATNMVAKDHNPPVKEVGRDKKKRTVELPYIKGFSNIIGAKFERGIAVPVDDSDAFLAPYFKAVYDLNATFSPYVRVLRDEKVLNYINNWMAILNKERASKEKVLKVIDLIKQDLFSYLISTTKFKVNGVTFDLQNEKERLFYGDDTIADRLIQAKKKYPDNVFLKRLYPIKSKRKFYYGTKVETADGVNFYSSKTDKTEQNALVQGFEQLINDDPSFGYDVVKVCILQTGLKNSPISFWNTIPANLFNQMMSEVLSQDDKNIAELTTMVNYRSHFEEQFPLNNVKNKEIMKEYPSLSRQYYVKYYTNDRGTKIVPAVPTIVKLTGTGENIAQEKLDPKSVAITDWREKSSLTAWSNGEIASTEMKKSEIDPNALVPHEEVPEEILSMSDRYDVTTAESQEVKGLWDNIENTAEEITPKIKASMTFSYGSDKRNDVNSDTTIEAIKNGERTATTRYESDGHIDYWKSAKVGDIIEFKGKNGETVLVRVTKELHRLKGSGETAEQWSKKEGWSVDYFNRKVRPRLNEAWQIEYELLNDSSEESDENTSNVPFCLK